MALFIYEARAVLPATASAQVAESLSVKA